MRSGGLIRSAVKKLKNNIIIKALTPALLNDYLNFFDNDAFADNPHWSACYCRCHHFDHKECDFDSTSAEENRAAVIDLINNGHLKGYLAYNKRKPIGWLNANTRKNFSAVPYDKLNGSEKVGSIMCFVIAKDYRRQGIAQKLLESACEDFKRQGLEIVEGYPVIDVVGDDKNYHGPLSLYFSAGFEEFDRSDRGEVTVVIVRKNLFS